jgi:hypothetical protein
MRSDLRQKFPDVIDHGLRGLYHSAELTFVKGASLKPSAIPAELAELTCTTDGQSLTLSTRRFHGACFSSLTIAAISSAQRLRSLTVIGLPQPGSPGPVLGIDIIALRGQISLLAIDLSPTDLDFWESHCRQPLEQLAAGLNGATVPRKLPAFSADSFSSLSVICGARVGQEAPVFDAIEIFLFDALQVAQQATKAAPSVAARDRRASWLLAEQRNRKEHEAFSRMFGPAIAARYLDDFLFGAEAGLHS